MAAFGSISHAPLVSTQRPSRRWPVCRLALPGSAATGLLERAQRRYGEFPDVLGLAADLRWVIGWFRALLGEARAEGATASIRLRRGRVLGSDWAPEVKTIRRKINSLLAEPGSNVAD